MARRTSGSFVRCINYDCGQSVRKSARSIKPASVEPPRRLIAQVALTALLALLLAGIAPGLATGSHAGYYANLAKLGPVGGVHLSSGGVAGDWAAFQGISYAAAPVGPLRFMPPAAGRAGEPGEPALLMPEGLQVPVRSYLAPGPPCPRPGGVALASSEDCLKLNVYVPLPVSPHAAALSSNLTSSSGPTSLPDLGESRAGMQITSQTSGAPSDNGMQDKLGSQTANQAGHPMRSLWPLTGQRAPLPVLVLLQGDRPSAGEPGHALQPHYLSVAREANALLVTFNYRVGLLGFLPFEAPGGAPARLNHALWDQIGLLKWLARNAAAFGADPLNVTLAAADPRASLFVQLLAMSPMAKGLFKRAILVQEQSSLGQAQTTPPRLRRALGGFDPPSRKWTELGLAELLALAANARDLRRQLARQLGHALARLDRRAHPPSGRPAEPLPPVDQASVFARLQAADTGLLAELELELALELDTSGQTGSSQQHAGQLVANPSLDDRLLFPHLSALVRSRLELVGRPEVAHLEQVRAQAELCLYLRQLEARRPDPLGLLGHAHPSPGDPGEQARPSEVSSVAPRAKTATPRGAQSANRPPQGDAAFAFRHLRQASLLYHFLSASSSPLLRDRAETEVEPPNESIFAHTPEYQELTPVPETSSPRSNSLLEAKPPLDTTPPSELTGPEYRNEPANGDNNNNDDDDEEEEEDEGEVFARLGSSRRHQDKTLADHGNSAAGSTLFARRATNSTGRGEGGSLAKITSGRAGRARRLAARQQAEARDFHELLALLSSFELMLGIMQPSPLPISHRASQFVASRGSSEVNSARSGSGNTGSEANFNHIANALLNETTSIHSRGLIDSFKWLEMHHIATIAGDPRSLDSLCDLTQSPGPMGLQSSPSMSYAFFLETAPVDAEQGQSGSWISLAVAKSNSLGKGLANFVKFGDPNGQPEVNNETVSLATNRENSWWPAYSTIDRSFALFGFDNGTRNITQVPRAERVGRIRTELTVQLDLVPYLKFALRPEMVNSTDRSPQDLLECLADIDSSIDKWRPRLNESHSLRRLKPEIKCLASCIARLRGSARQLAEDQLEPLSRLISRQIQAQAGTGPTSSMITNSLLKYPAPDGPSRSSNTSLSDTNNGSLAASRQASASSNANSNNSNNSKHETGIRGFFAKTYRDAMGKALTIVIGTGLSILLLNLLIVLIIALRSKQQRRRQSRVAAQDIDMAPKGFDDFVEATITQGELGDGPLATVCNNGQTIDNCKSLFIHQGDKSSELYSGRSLESQPVRSNQKQRAVKQLKFDLSNVNIPDQLQLQDGSPIMNEQNVECQHELPNPSQTTEFDGSYGCAVENDNFSPTVDGSSASSSQHLLLHRHHHHHNHIVHRGQNQRNAEELELELDHLGLVHIDPGTGQARHFRSSLVDLQIEQSYPFELEPTTWDVGRHGRHFRLADRDLEAPSSCKPCPNVSQVESPFASLRSCGSTATTTANTNSSSSNNNCNHNHDKMELSSCNKKHASGNSLTSSHRTHLFAEAERRYATVLRKRLAHQPHPPMAPCLQTGSGRVLQSIQQTNANNNSPDSLTTLSVTPIQLEQCLAGVDRLSDHGYQLEPIGLLYQASGSFKELNRPEEIILDPVQVGNHSELPLIQKYY